MDINSITSTITFLATKKPTAEEIAHFFRDELKASYMEAVAIITFLHQTDSLTSDGDRATIKPDIATIEFTNIDTGEKHIIRLNELIQPPTCDTDTCSTS